MVKTVPKSEAEFFLTFIDEYVEYMNKNRNSLLTRFFGLHSVTLYNLTIYFVVMENVFLSGIMAPHEKYDLKGSWVNRHTNYRVGRKVFFYFLPVRQFIAIMKDLFKSMYLR